MIKKLGLVLVFSVSLIGSLAAAPLSTWQNAAGREVLVYGIPQQAGETAVEELMKELKELSSKGVGQLLVDDVSPATLAKINSGLSKLYGKQPWDEIGVPITYLDVRVIERIALIIRGLAALSAMDYIEGSNDLEQIYQQWGFTPEQSKAHKDRYQALFAPSRQQICQMLNQIGTRNITQRESEQIQTLYKKYEQCFINHFFIIFGSTRKWLVAEHNALLQEITAYKDGDVLVAEYKKICDQFKKSAIWLYDASAEETLYGYLRRCDLLSDHEKNEIEAFKKKNPTQAPAIEDMNLMKMVSAGLPLIAIRAIHCIINAQKPVALFILDSAVQESINMLLQKTGYTKNAPQA